MPIKCDHGQIDENSWYWFAGAAGNAKADKGVPSPRNVRPTALAGSMDRIQRLAKRLLNTLFSLLVVHRKKQFRIGLYNSNF